MSTHARTSLLAAVVLATCVPLSAHALGQSTVRVSVDTNGVQANADILGVSISGDGRYTVFFSGATTLVPGDTNATWDTFVHDRQTGVTECVSVGPGGVFGNQSSVEGVLSNDGRWVAFASGATNLGPTDTNNETDIYLRDRLNGITTLVSVSSTGTQANNWSRAPAISSDGRFIVFESFATNLVPGVNVLQRRIFLHDRDTGVTTCPAVDSFGVPANGDCNESSVSGDGRWVVFASLSTNLIPCCDSNNNYDIFLRDTLAGSTTRISIGLNTTEANGDSYTPRISPDGRYVAFQSNAPNLAAGDVNGLSDVFVYDIQTNTTRLASIDSHGAQANGYSSQLSISSNGRFIAFGSIATNLIPNDTNGFWDIFVHDMQTGGTTIVDVDDALNQADGGSGFVSLSTDGRYVAFTSFADNLVPGDTNGRPDAFVRDRGSVVPGYSSFCFGEGSLATPCPCGNFGSGGHGCGNSVNSFGARLIATGSVLPDLFTGTDTIVLSASGMPATATSVFLQGNAPIAAGVFFGDGVRCAGGQLIRLAVKVSSAGNSQFPEPGDLSLSQKGGVGLGTGTTRFYQTYYRDSNLAFCPDPPGNSWNVTNGIQVVW